MKSEWSVFAIGATHIIVGCCVLIASAWSAATSLSAEDAPNDSVLIVFGARVWTGDIARPWAEAIAVRGNRIVAVGAESDVKTWMTADSRRIPANGRFVMPGFIDCHVHFLTGGARLAGVQLRDANSRAEFTERIRAFARSHAGDEWITGGDWDHTLWGGELPTKEWIDAAAPKRPVWVNRLDGHMALANSAALNIAGVTKATPEVAGGEIVRDESGEPTGVLKDNAMALVDRHVPSPTDAQNDRAFDAATRYVAALGITSVHHMGQWSDLPVFERARSEGRLQTRINAAVPLSTWERLADRVAQHGGGDSWIRVQSLKGFVDGSLGSHTAAFVNPYSDKPSDRGLLVNSRDALLNWTTGADAAGLQVAVHAIGDRAIRMQLDLFEQVAAENGPRDRRFRIEHAQHIARAELARFRLLNVIPSMQPYHCIDDGRWAEPLIGLERAKTSYAFRSLIDLGGQGSRPVFGSDWYVAPASPLAGIYAAVTRRTLDGKHPDGWVPEQRIAVEEALRAYTADAAHASFEEREKGILAPGKLADYVMLDRDPTTIDPGELRDIRVEMTVVGGRIVFDQRDARADQEHEQ